MPARVPNEVKRRRGNPGGRPLPDPAEVAPVAPVVADAVPKHLNKAGKELWAIATEHASAWLGESDRALLVMACELADERASLKRAIKSKGVSYETPSGRRFPNPEVTMLREVETQLVRVMSLLGFTPTDRSRLGVAEVTARSALEDLLAKQARNRGAG